MKAVIAARDHPFTRAGLASTETCERFLIARRFGTSRWASTLRLATLFAGVIAGVTIDLHSASADCQGERSWLRRTPAPTFERPPPHPAPDCGFYKPAWQNFLYVTQLEGGASAFESYPTIADVFGAPATSMFAAKSPGRLSLAPRALKGPNDPTTEGPGRAGVNNAASITDVRQAGLNGLLIDQNGRPIFYAIHMNEAFAAFIRQKQLTTKAAVQGADPDWEFPKGAVELKSAWQIVPDNNVPTNYITRPASVPVLKRTGDKVEVDSTAPPRNVTVALLAIHVVFVLDGHPEFIWATFEHVDGNGMRDLAPAAGALPGGVDGPVSVRSFTLYKGGTAASAANQFIADAEMASAFDEATQSFTRSGAARQTSIYRIFPSSKSTETGEDKDISDLTSSMRSLFASNAPNDVRQNYQLVGAIWLDKPETSFAVNKKFANPAGMSTDDPAAPVAGEDGLSSMALESFTQDSFVNCFSCHDTRAVKDLSGNVLLSPKKLNVSRILSKFVNEAN